MAEILSVLIEYAGEKPNAFRPWFSAATSRIEEPKIRLSETLNTVPDVAGWVRLGMNSKMQRHLDDVDLTILDLLQRNGRLSHIEIGRIVGLAVSSVHERVSKLVRRGVIAGWTAKLAPGPLGLDLLAFVYVLMDKPESSAAFLTVVNDSPEVLECHHVASDWNFLLKIRVRNTAAFEALLTERLKAVPGVVRTQTIIALSSYKDTATLPVRS